MVGLSGGVDSAVAAALLLREGYDVTGVFVRIALPGYPCAAGEDRLEALRVAAHLKIPFLELDLSRAYEKTVFQPTIIEFFRGRTPNPDALCNREIKFGLLYDFVRSHNATYIATGHYVQTEKNEGKVELHRGVDALKDQSYFLWGVPEEALGQSLFPVGGYQKSRVRELAKKFKLPNALRKDSQGLCFLGDITVEDMLVKEGTLSPGNVLDEEGMVIGKHRGAALYTLGQRHGFELVAHSPHSKAHFVAGKDMLQNTLTVSVERTPIHYKKTKLHLSEENWIGTVSEGPCQARFRYRQPLIAAHLERQGGSAVVTLQEPHRVPEGQSVVLYRETRCLGGGIVDNALLQQ